jgi:hypothetical protein
VAAVLVLLLLAGGLLVWQRPWESSGTTRTAELPDDVPTRLTDQLRELSGADSRAVFVEAAGSLPDAEAFAARTWGSLRALGVTGLELRYVSGGDVADRQDGSAEAVADVTWRAGRRSGLGDEAAHRATVLLRVAPQDGGGLSIVGARPRQGKLPVWLAGAVEVERGDGAVVVTIDGGADSFPLVRMAQTARTAVEEVVPRATGDVTLVVPRTQAQAADLVGEDPDQVAPIAAVATQLDDRGRQGARDVVVVNPEVFSTMDQRAAQVVLSHEATHLLTRAVGTRAATWVVEGFADYVALHDDTAPLSVSAGQVLAQVDAGTLPHTLPDADDFSSAGRRLGAVYESTWLIFRMLGEERSDADIVAFYESVLAGRPADDALRASLDLTSRQLTRQWRAYLTKSASTVS